MSEIHQILMVDLKKWNSKSFRQKQNGNNCVQSSPVQRFNIGEPDYCWVHRYENILLLMKKLSK